MTAPHLATDPADLRRVLALLHRAFARMAGRIDPPSSLARLTVADLAAAWEVWVTPDEGGAHPVGCMVLTPRPQALYLGKLAVAPERHRQGLARALIAVAEARARALNLPVLELQTRVELTENHAAFAALGFAQSGSTAHDGFARPTALTFTKPV